MEPKSTDKYKVVFTHIEGPTAIKLRTSQVREGGVISLYVEGKDGKPLPGWRVDIEPILPRGGG